MNWSFLQGPQYGPGTFANLFFGENPTAAYTGALTAGGFGPGSRVNPLGQYLQQQSGRAYQGYLSQVPFQGANYSYTDYLPQALSGFEREFENLAPQQRGLDYGKYAGRTRWVT